MRIAIDAMGGDHAPEAAVEGAVLAAEEYRELHLILIGDETEIRRRLPASLPSNIEIVHADEAIAMDEEPVQAVKRKRGSSMVKAVQMVKERAADAVISAGNTGAFMTAGLLIVGRIRGIDRPALAPLLPSVSGGGTLVLDVGANMDAKPGHLLQYAIMGNIYAQHVLCIAEPRVGLLNVGTEDKKGNELTKETFPLLEKANLRFIGNVEARDVVFGVCDVLVCDGFSGNVLLKAAEGIARAVFEMLKNEMTRSWPNKLAATILRPSLRRLKHKLDYAEYGGAPLLGLQGACIKAHGSSDARAFKNAIKQAERFVEHRVIELISKEINFLDIGKG
ncbi:phosphate acyltransferase PlsX [Bacillaceae bacterium]